MDELTENAEEPDEGESKQSEVKLGKLQYKVSFLHLKKYRCEIKSALSQTFSSNFWCLVNFNLKLDVDSKYLDQK